MYAHGAADDSPGQIAVQKTVSPLIFLLAGFT